MKIKQKHTAHVYVVKAEWAATAKLFHVTATDEEDAVVKAEKAVLRMEGGIRCLNVKLVRMVK